MGGLLHGPYSKPFSLTIDASHQNIHDGYMWEVSAKFALATAGDIMEVALSVPNGVYPHAIFEVASEKVAAFTVIEGVTSLAGGAAMTEVNQNRNSSVATTVAGTLGVTGTAITYSGGTTIKTRQITTASSAGSGSFAAELVLKTGSVTVFRLVSGANSCDASIAIRWYESPR